MADLQATEKFLTYQNALALVQSRGYALSQDEQKFLSYNEEDDLDKFKELIMRKGGLYGAGNFEININVLSNYYVHPRRPGRLFLCMTGPLEGGRKEIPIDLLRQIFAVNVNIEPDPQIKEIIFVFPAKLSSSARNLLAVEAETRQITIFQENDLFHNPLTHVLTSQQVKIDLAAEESKKQFLAERNLSSVKDLPRILDSDVASKWLGNVAGEVVFCLRDCRGLGLTCPRIVGYRHVVQDM